jgi:streptogramin lyase
MIAFDPRTRRSATYALPTPWSGPRRFDIDAAGIVWIPAYAANALVRLDPVTGEFTEIPMPVPGATPYIARVEPSSGDVWIGTSAADAVFRYDPAAGAFATYPLASQGALIRHMAIDPARGDVWLAYGASPGRIPARVARIRRPASR